MEEKVFSQIGRSKIYHHPVCPHALRMNRKTRGRVGRADLELAGFRPCRLCCPGAAIFSH